MSETHDHDEPVTVRRASTPAARQPTGDPGSAPTPSRAPRAEEPRAEDLSASPSSSMPADAPVPIPAHSPAAAMPGRPLGEDGLPLIETLPPLPEQPGDIPVSPSTGQPRRDPVMLVAIAFLYAAGVAATVGFGLFWWRAINITDFAGSARLMQWTAPRPGSWQSMALSGVVALVTIATVAAPCVAAFQAWNGHRWSRTAGLVAVATSLLTILLNAPALLAIPLSAVGAGILWLPPVRRYFDHWERFRADDQPRPRPVDRVHYGPLERYLARETPRVRATGRQPLP